MSSDHERETRGKNEGCEGGGGSELVEELIVPTFLIFK